MSGFAVAHNIATEDKRRGRKNKMYANHKMLMSGGDEMNETFHKHVFRSVRSQVLQKLMILWYVYMYNSKSDAPQELIKRYKKEHHGSSPGSFGDIISVLKPEDVMETIHCSRRTAIEYIQVLQFIRPTDDVF